MSWGAIGLGIAFAAVRLATGGIGLATAAGVVTLSETAGLAVATAGFEAAVGGTVLGVGCSFESC